MLKNKLRKNDKARLYLLENIAKNEKKEYLDGFTRINHFLPTEIEKNFFVIDDKKNNHRAYKVMDIVEIPTIKNNNKNNNSNYASNKQIEFIDYDIRRRKQTISTMKFIHNQSFISKLNLDNLDEDSYDGSLILEDLNISNNNDNSNKDLKKLNNTQKAKGQEQNGVLEEFGNNYGSKKNDNKPVVKIEIDKSNWIFKSNEEKEKDLINKNLVILHRIAGKPKIKNETDIEYEKNLKNFINAINLEEILKENIKKEKAQNQQSKIINENKIVEVKKDSSTRILQKYDTYLRNTSNNIVTLNITPKKQLNSTKFNIPGVSLFEHTKQGSDSKIMSSFSFLNESNDDSCPFSLCKETTTNFKVNELNGKKIHKELKEIDSKRKLNIPIPKRIKSKVEIHASKNEIATNKDKINKQNEESYMGSFNSTIVEDRKVIKRYSLQDITYVNFEKLKNEIPKCDKDKYNAEIYRNYRNITNVGIKNNKNNKDKHVNFNLYSSLEQASTIKEYEYEEFTNSPLRFNKGESEIDFTHQSEKLSLGKLTSFDDFKLSIDVGSYNKNSESIIHSDKSITFDIEKELQKRFSNIPKADNYYKSIDTNHEFNVLINNFNTNLTSSIQQAEQEAKDANTNSNHTFQTFQSMKSEKSDRLYNNYDTNNLCNSIISVKSIDFDSAKTIDFE